MVDSLISCPHVEVVLFSTHEWPGRSATSLRFSPGGEAGVEAVIVRDTDSRINLREAAAVAEWLAAPSAKYHVMHESMHDAGYGEVLGGMWGCRRCANEGPHLPPCPGMAEALESWRGSLSEEERGSYGADMRFLASFLVPLLNERNSLHHVDGSDRSLGRLDSIPRCPFPNTVFRGFVGQPIDCRCRGDFFLSAGCDHCNRALPSSISSRLMGQPDVLAALSRFLG